MTRYLRATVHARPRRPQRALALHGRRRGRRLRQRHAGRSTPRPCATTTRTPGRRRQIVDVANLLHGGRQRRSPSQVKNRLNGSGDATPGALHRAACRPTARPSTRRSAWKSSTRPAPSGWRAAGVQRQCLAGGPGGGRPTARAPGERTSSLPQPPRPSCARPSPSASRSPQARLYATALGLYELRLNGAVGDDVLAPGWTDYKKRVHYQAYDVTAPSSRATTRSARGSATAGTPAACMAAASGATAPALLAQLELTFTDGTRPASSTDDTLAGRTGGRPRGRPLQRRDLRRPPGAPAGTCPASTTAGATRSCAPRRRRSSPTARPPITVIQTLQPKTVTQPSRHRSSTSARTSPAGPGSRPRRRRHAGQAALRRDAQRRRHALHRPTCAPPSRPTRSPCAGTGARRPRSRASPSTASATSRSPASTGARSTEHASSASRPPASSAPSRLERAGEPAPAAHPLGPARELPAVPTDASQRDERLGWTGDIQAFAATAAFNSDARASSTSGCTTCRLRSGRRRLHRRRARTCCGDGTAGWGDAGTIVPYTLCKRYGDPRSCATTTTRWRAGSRTCAPTAAT